MTNDDWRDMVAELEMENNKLREENRIFRNAIELLIDPKTQEEARSVVSATLHKLKGA